MTWIEVALRPKTINRLVLLITYSLVLISFSQPIYGTTDDKILAGFVDGSYTGEREIQTIFIQPVINFILIPFYYFFPNFGWYAIFQVGLVLIALSLIPPALNALKPFLNKYFLALSLFILSWQIPQITFTSTAILTFLLTSLLLFLYLLNGEKSKLKITIVVIVFILSFHWRTEAVLGISTLLILPITKYFKRLIKSNRNLIAIFLITLTSITSFNYFLREANASEEWDSYNQWNSYRHQLQNRISQDDLWKDLEKISWSPAEHNLFISLSYGDPSVFNSQWIKPAFELSRSKTGLNGLIYADPTYTLKETIKVFQDYKVELFYLIFLAILLLILFRTVQTFFLIFLTWMQGLITTYFMTATLHTPERVIIPLFIGCTIISLVLILDQYLARLPKINLINTATLVGFLVFIFAPGGLKDDFSYRENAIKDSNEVKQVLSNFDEKNILLGSVGTEVNHLVNPFVSSKFEKDLKSITVGNWETFSPHWEKRNFKLGIRSKNVYEDLVQNPKVLWITQEIPDTAYKVELYLREQNISEFERRGLKTGLDGLNVFSFAPDSP
jgi:hypothetical protein